MTPNATDDSDGRAGPDDQSRRYADVSIGHKEFVIYDRENHKAWIQSTVAMRVEEQC